MWAAELTSILCRVDFVKFRQHMQDFSVISSKSAGLELE